MARAAAAPEEAADSRELILRAALRAFAERGFDGASTRDIASEAGVNHGLIPYYFGSKGKLWQAAVDLAFGELKAGFDAVLAERGLLDDRVRVEQMIHAHVRFVAAHPEFVRLMHDEGKRSGPRMRWLVDRHVKPLYEVIAALVERARSRAMLPDDLTPLHFFYVFAGATGLLFHQAEECKRLTGQDPFAPEIVEQHARVVARMLLGPPQEETSP
jgi:AcrR family transcriptional regulator